jgi:hypothetical protein
MSHELAVAKPAAAALPRALALFTALLLAALLSGVGTGCAYRLGTGGKPPFTTLALAPIKSDAHIPQAQSILHTQLSDAFAQEGNVRLTDGAAQALLTVRLVKYERTVAATARNDTALGVSFNLELTAECDLVDTRTGKPLFEHRRIVARTVAHAPADTAASQSTYAAAEYTTVPILTRDLARQIRDTVTGVW